VQRLLLRCSLTSAGYMLGWLSQGVVLCWASGNLYRQREQSCMQALAALVLATPYCCTEGA